MTDWKFAVTCEGRICSQHRKLEGALIRLRQLQNKIDAPFKIEPICLDAKCPTCGKPFDQIEKTKSHNEICPKPPKPPARSLTQAEYAALHKLLHHRVCRLFGKHDTPPQDAISLLMLVTATIFKSDVKCTLREATEAIAQMAAATAEKMKRSEGGFAE